MNKELFENAYKNNSWDGVESRSGIGSDLKETEEIRKNIPKIFQKYEIKTIVDIPCGDFNWLKEIIDELNLDKYLGIDIIEPVIRYDRKNFGKQNQIFKCIDVTNKETSIPKVDLILCRDFFLHLSFEDIYKTLKQFKKSGSKYLLTSNFRLQDMNYDQETQLFGRGLNLQLHPFNFPKSIESILEKCTLENNKYYDSKCLSLWLIKDLQI